MNPHLHGILRALQDAAATPDGGTPPAPSTFTLILVPPGTGPRPALTGAGPLRVSRMRAGTVGMKRPSRPGVVVGTPT